MPNAGYLWCQRLPKQCIWLPAFSWLPIRNRYWNSIAEKTTYFGYRTQRHQANPHPVRRKYVGSCEGEVFSSLTQLWALHATVLPCQARHAHHSKTRERGSKKMRRGMDADVVRTHCLHLGDCQNEQQEKEPDTPASYPRQYPSWSTVGIAWLMKFSERHATWVLRKVFKCHLLLKLYLSIRWKTSATNCNKAVLKHKISLPFRGSPSTELLLFSRTFS